MYVVIEGVDGSGKTEVTSRLIPLLNAIFDRSVLLIQEPDKKLISHVNSSDDKVNSLLMYIQRLQSIKMIQQYRKNGIILSDRSFYSTFAYQGQDNWLFVQDLHKLMKQHIEIPDIAFVLLTDLDVAIERIQKRESRELGQEEIDKMKRADMIYSMYKMPDVETIYVNANGSPVSVADEILIGIIAKFARMEGRR